MTPPTARKFSGVFISYRREDSAGHTGRLYDRLSAHFGDDQVFMDIDQLEPGEDFVQIIEDAVGSCEILLAVIGRRWLSADDETSRRLDNPNDFVRLEIAAALRRNIRVIPVLVQGAAMPKQDELPDELSGLSRRHALELSDLRWKRDVEQLIDAVERIRARQQEARLRASQEEEERRAAEAEAQRRDAEESRQKQEAGDTKSQTLEGEGTRSKRGVEDEEAQWRKRQVERGEFKRAAESFRRAREADKHERRNIEDELVASSPTPASAGPGRPRVAARPPLPKRLGESARRAVTEVGTVLRRARAGDRAALVTVAILLTATLAAIVALMEAAVVSNLLFGGNRLPVSGQSGAGVTAAGTPSSGRAQPVASQLAGGAKPVEAVRNGIGMELVWISPGSFEMGSAQGRDDEKPVHVVTITKGFYMGKYEVTQAQWQRVMGTNPSSFKGCGNCPVERVSWVDAKDFVSKLSKSDIAYEYRLPTEAEWEYACRAGTTTEFAFGNTLSPEQANFDPIAAQDPYRERTVPVGSFPPNPVGLHDMHGNVEEWCEDNYSENYAGAPKDGSAWLGAGDQAYRVTRGGSWYGLPAEVRSAKRSKYHSSEANHLVGLRVVAIERQ